MPADIIPINPPAEWFAPPEQGIPTDKRITIEASGRTYGYVALWDTCHVGMGGCTKPPKGSPTAYEYAHQGETLTADGSMIRTAVIAGGTGHPGQDVKVPVPEFYANSGTQLMRVRYGEDSNGLYFAGALWPDATELQVAQIRASAVSGDWRFHAAWRHTQNGGYDFAGSILVNIPGYPMPNGNAGADMAGRMRAIAASAGDGWILSEGDMFVDSGAITAEATELHTASSAIGENEMLDNECLDCNKELPAGITEEQIISAVSVALDAIRADAAVEADPRDALIASLTDQVTALNKRFESIDAEDLARQLIEE